MPLAEYTKIRREHRRKLVELKQQRRVHIGPYVTLYFENYDTMWAQVQEMLYIERGGEAQIEGELSAYNPLIPKGAELVATMMIEIEDEGVRRRILASLGHVEDMVRLTFRRPDHRRRARGRHGPHHGRGQDLVGALSALSVHAATGERRSRKPGHAGGRGHQSSGIRPHGDAAGRNPRRAGRTDFERRRARYCTVSVG